MIRETMTKTYLMKGMWVIIIFLFILLFTCTPAHSQRAVLVASEKVKLSTYYKVTVRTDSCNEYEGRWNSHCFRCSDVSIVPVKWDVIETKRGKYFIKPQL